MSANTASSQGSQTSPAQVDQLPASPLSVGGSGADRQATSLLLNHLNTYPVVVRVSTINMHRSD